jgi:hypothetical protein
LEEQGLLTPEAERERAEQRKLAEWERIRALLDRHTTERIPPSIAARHRPKWSPDQPFKRKSSRFSPEQVREIRRQHRAGCTTSSIARNFECNRALLSPILERHGEYAEMD